MLHLGRLAMRQLEERPRNPVRITSGKGHPDLLLHSLDHESVIWQKPGTCYYIIL